MKELKDYSILDIEVIDDDRFKKEKAPGKWVPESRVYLKEEVDAAIAELKAALKESEEARYEAGADAADYYQETRRLKRALWLARAKAANEAHFMWCQLIYDKKYGIVKFNVRKEWYKNIKQGQTLHTPQGWADVWDDVERKCRAKAEEYK